MFFRPLKGWVFIWGVQKTILYTKLIFLTEHPSWKGRMVSCSMKCTKWRNRTLISQILSLFVLFKIEFNFFVFESYHYQHLCRLNKLTRLVWCIQDLPEITWVRHYGSFRYWSLDIWNFGFFHDFWGFGVPFGAVPPSNPGYKTGKFLFPA